VERGLLCPSIEPDEELSVRIPIAVMKTSALAGMLAAIAVLYATALRPWFLTWGTTPAERDKRLLGDEAFPGSIVTSTRAITVEARVGAVWPWLAQLGQDRGGFYSYEVLEDLVGARMENADRILPGRQEWRPGDKLRMYPAGKLEPTSAAPLLAQEPGRALAFGTYAIGSPQGAPLTGTWAFVLEPRDEHTTRLLIRGRARGEPGAMARLFHLVAFEAMHFVMERKTMEGIKALAEGRRPSYLADTLEVALWTITAALFVASVVATYRRRRWIRPLFCAAGAALGFQLLTFGQRGPVVAAIVVVVLALGLWWRAAVPGLPREMTRWLETLSRPSSA
jgi:hypothetical protein